MTLTATFDLCVVVEEVVDAIYAGQTFRRSHAGLDTEAYDHQDTSDDVEDARKLSSKADDDGKLAMIISVASDTNWKVHTQPGAVRRIIMNLLGNALKYTDNGR